MANHHGRLYALALGLVVFFLAWSVVAAHPWAKASVDPRLHVLAVREAELRREAVHVQKIVAARWAQYRAQLKQRRAEIAKITAAPPPAAVGGGGGGAVQIVTLPAHVVTRTS